MLDIVSHYERKPIASIDLILNVFDTSYPNTSFFTPLPLFNIQVYLINVHLLLSLNHKREHVLVMLLEAVVHFHEFFLFLWINHIVEMEKSILRVFLLLISLRIMDRFIN